ncbi:MAG TPA: RnfABCDGE type electron transport complex subunit D [Candidatus Alectryocaccomicrobium excrementavium]|uniref:Ion-translocating oxidoreductase complex subunit D n=1 Tax=Candidatus Alectryocaccomicrobium excrementavium TaxID=2840668 RepID=A0A9D1K5L5_9FIRM|nr:RnfABCDGE type electron transport complex subunit D [Candidatus Alectryocaccomicrobium excrementavium]
MQTAKVWRVASSPHIHAGRTVRGIMLDVIVALLPAGAFGVAWFGVRALWVIAVSVASAVAWEALWCWLVKKPCTVGDLSAVVTGLLLAYNLPATVPLWLPVVGTGLAIVLVKQCFGGLGQNFMNPALAARAILMSSWVGLMSGNAYTLVDAATSATPLAQGADYALEALFWGTIPGCIGEVCKPALLAGGLYLLARGVISWRIPVTMLAVSFGLFWISLGSAEGALRQVLSGGLLLGAFFMATDYASSPTTPVGRLIMGAGCALVLFVIRTFSALPEGCSYAILFMNLAAPLIERFTQPRVFGEVKRRA